MARGSADGGISVRDWDFQVLHVHVLLVAPLRAGHVAEPHTNKH